MKAAFFHDAPLVYSKDGQVYSIGFAYNIWERYLSVFDTLVVSTRMRVSNNDSSIKNRMKLSSGPKVEFKPISRYRKKLDIILNSKQILLQIRETLEQCDCAIIRLPSTIGQIACKEAERMGRPYLIEVVGCAFDALWNHGTVAGKVLAPISYVRTKEAIKKSKYTIYITKQFLQSRYLSTGRIAVCPNVDIKNVEEEVLDKRVTKINSNSEFVFGLIGSLDVAYKGHETVIKALPLIVSNIPKFKIEFLGGGNPAKWIQLAKEYNVDNYIDFKGVLPSGEKVYEWLDSIDISLQPSFAEGQGRSIIEAMSRACPVIATKVGGIVELIDDAWLVSVGDHVELAKKIIKLAKNKEMLKQQATRNFQEAKQYYKENIDETRVQFLKDFRKFVGNK